MSLADVVFSAGSICFAIALLPMVFGPHKPARSSAILTAAWLYAFAVTYLTLGLVFSALTTAITAGIWTELAFNNNRRDT